MPAQVMAILKLQQRVLLTTISCLRANIGVPPTLGEAIPWHFNSQLNYLTQPWYPYQPILETILDFPVDS